MFKIILIADSPASVASILPLVDYLDHETSEVFKVSPYARLKIHSGISVNSMEEYKRTANNKITDDTAIIYGTGSGNPRELNIPLVFPNNKCIAIHDLLSLSEEEIYNRKYHFSTNVIVPNKEIGDKLDSVLGKGFSLNLGNPNLDKASKKFFPLSKTKEVKIVFVSQPDGIEFSNSTANECKFLILELYQSNFLNCQVTGLHVCLHPRENSDFVERLISKGFNLTYSRGDTISYLKLKSIIIGTQSAVLYESFLFGNITYKVSQDFTRFRLERYRLTEEDITSNAIMNIVSTFFSI